MKTINNRGFTLVELLVVIAIIGILIGMLLPAVQQVRESARRTHCLNNMRQIGLATLMFTDTNEAFPPARLSTEPDPFAPVNSFTLGAVVFGPESWFVRMLPFVEQQGLHEKWDFSIDYVEQSIEAIGTPVDTFLCSSRHTVSNATARDVTIVSGAGG